MCPTRDLIACLARFRTGLLLWQIVPEVELTTMYVMTDRTNVLVAPYEQVDGDLLRFQLQWNY